MSRSPFPIIGARDDTDEGATDDKNKDEDEELGKSCVGLTINGCFSLAVPTGLDHGSSGTAGCLSILSVPLGNPVARDEPAAAAMEPLSPWVGASAGAGAGAGAGTGRDFVESESESEPDEELEDESGVFSDRVFLSFCFRLLLDSGFFLVRGAEARPIFRPTVGSVRERDPPLDGAVDAVVPLPSAGPDADADIDVDGATVDESMAWAGAGGGRVDDFRGIGMRFFFFFFSGMATSGFPYVLRSSNRQLRRMGMRAGAADRAAALGCDSSET
jgi:hypothetical protein